MDAEAPEAEPGALRHWVFLRGLVRESAHWNDFPEQFSAAVPGSQVLTIDLPGNGRRHLEASPLSLSGYLESVRREALEICGDQPRKFYLLSLSLGGMIAVEWVRRYPEELFGAVLINTSLRGLNPLHHRLSPKSWPLLARIFGASKLADREHLILRLTSKRRAEEAELIQSRVDIQRRRPVTGRNALRQLLAAARYAAPAQMPPIPLLLLNSRGDRMVDPRCTEAIARTWQVAHRTHPWGGHDLPLDDPDWIIAQVSSWLKAPEGGAVVTAEDAPATP